MTELTMTTQELHNLLSRYVEVGCMEAVRAYEPTADWIRETEVKQWLKHMRVDYKKFKAMIEAGLINFKRKGTARNSPKYYSKKDIIQALATSEVANIMARNAIAQSLI